MRVTDHIQHSPKFDAGKTHEDQVGRSLGTCTRRSLECDFIIDVI